MLSRHGSVYKSLQSAHASRIGSGHQVRQQDLAQRASMISIETLLPGISLIVESLTGREAMSELFRFDIECLATSSHESIHDLIGEEATVRLRSANGGSRLLHGMVIATRQLGEPGTLARYRLTLAPWLHALTMRRNSDVFHDKTVLEITEEIFRDYPAASYRFNVEAALPRRSITMQYRETDYDFIARLLAEEGLNFFIGHEEDHTTPEAVPRKRDGATQRARHRFIIFDNDHALAACDQPLIRFDQAGATEPADAIACVTQQYRVQANVVTHSSWDYKTLSAVSATASIRPRAPDEPDLEVYDGARAYRYTDMAESERIARTHAESLAMQHQTTSCESGVRTLAVGARVQLEEQPACALEATGQERGGEYIVLSIEHHWVNNLSAQTEMADSISDSTSEHGTYHNRFRCAPRSMPIRPAYEFTKPAAPGPQVAFVVGIRNQEITTERDHRVKVRFPWQRSDRPATGPRQHSATPDSSADETGGTGGTWVRVAEPSAGANWGAHFIPRVGQEVLIDFIAGDIDRPVIIGQLYNGGDAPPFQGGGNHPGALAGIRSKEYAADGFNQWMIDDTPHQLRQSLASSYGTSQLNIGYLIRQNGNARSVYRGTGFEMTTDAWGILRAGGGMLLTTSRRQHATSTQLDTSEAQEKLKAAEALAEALSATAVRHHALPLSTPEGLQQLCDSICGTETADGHHAPRFNRPIALLDSQEAVNVTTLGTAIVMAGQDLSMTTGNMCLTGGQAISLAVAETVSVFAGTDGIKVIAANESLSLQAHAGPVKMIADKAMAITSSDGNVRIQADDEIVLTAGGGYIRLCGNDIEIHCPSSVSVKGIDHRFRGPGDDD